MSLALDSDVFEGVCEALEAGKPSAPKRDSGLAVGPSAMFLRFAAALVLACAVFIFAPEAVRLEAELLAE